MRAAEEWMAHSHAIAHCYPLVARRTRVSPTAKAAVPRERAVREVLLVHSALSSARCLLLSLLLCRVRCVLCVRRQLLD